MQSNYKSLGSYIQEVNVRNNELRVDRLLGVSIQKVLMPSIANTIGTDMRSYKILKKNQFAYGPVTSRNGDKISIALLEEFDQAIVSQAYTPFEITDTNKLHPEYLMMWFRRPEFDRYARFMSHGSAREIFGWDEMCNTLLPIPSIEKQREIVAEYNTLKNRIELNNQLIQKLEETAQAIYKQWFVDFEFPDENGKPYKSSGGKMVFNEDLDKEIPVGWKVSSLDDVIEAFVSKRGKSKSTMNLQQFSCEYKHPVISAMNISNGKIVKHETIPYVNTQEYDAWMDPKLKVDDVILTSEAPLGETYYLAINSDYAISQRLFALRTKKEKVSGWFLYLWFNTPVARQKLEGRSSGTTVFGIKLSELKKLDVLVPDNIVVSMFTRQTIPIAEFIEVKSYEIQKLSDLKNLLLSKLATIEG